MTVVEEILEWSEDRPDWQRDALRRLAQKRQLEDEDISQLTELCLTPYRPDDDVGGSIPLRSEHLGSSQAQEHPTRLREIRAVENVNALEPGASLPIAPTGITLIYGGNGTGKTGYVRILRQVCRARGETPTILPNVYENGGGATAKAQVRYQLGEDEPDQLEEVIWQEDATTDENLKAVSIFDQRSASVYVDHRQEVAYLPFGLDLLPRLADVCGSVRERIEERIRGLEEDALRLPEVLEETEAGKLLAQLDHEDARERLQSLASISEDEQERLRALNRQLGAEDPGKRAAELRARSHRIWKFSEDLRGVFDAVRPNSVEEIGKALNDLENAREAARIASNEAFGDEPLPGTGSDPWRELWQAARKFSVTVASPDTEFPPTEGEPCLLCQRDLDERAAKRMKRFEEFVKSDIEERVKQAEVALKGLQSNLKGLSLPSLEGISGDLQLEEEALIAEARMALSQLKSRLNAIQAAEENDDLDDLPSFPSRDLLRSLAHVAGLVDQRSRELETAAEDDERQRLQAERNELEGRKVLRERNDDLLDEIRRYESLGALDDARRDTNTTGITLRSKKLTRDAVTERLAQAFGDEVKKLQLKHLPIRVADSPGERGTAYHEIELEGAASPPGQVLSQGEHRCVALAGFLAELSVQDSSSSVVLDDPVSSLDHDRREYVAKRLVETASDRPVVVFTHDLVFLFQLNSMAQDVGVPVTPLRLERTQRVVGRVVEEWPWKGMTLGRRIGKLKQLQQKAGAAFRKGRKDEYESMAREIYGYLREAWERGVEEILLNEAVVRFGREVQTKRLRSLSRIKDEHLDALEAGMTKSSKYLRGHDDALATMEPVPEPDELKADIEELDRWRVEVQQLHQ